MRKGTKHLRIASVIQIILGVLGILLTVFLLREGDASTAEVSGKTAMGLLIAAYAGYGLQIFAGLMGLLLANKKSLFTVILGVLLYIPQLIAFWRAGTDFWTIVLNILLLLIPYYYLHNAYRNYKD